MQRRPTGKLKQAAIAFFDRTDLKAAKANPFTAGLVAAAESATIEVWPENHAALQLLIDLQTQWTVGHAGRTGLHYPAAYPLIDRLTDTDDDWWQMLRDLQAMEIAVLNAQSPDT